MEAVVVIAFLAVVFGFLLVKTVQSLIHISGPNEILVFSGLKQNRGDRTRGYKLIKGGKGIRIPLLEVVDRMDLTNMIIDVNVTGAYSKGGIPLNVQAVANVKIAGDDPLIHNALERLLGKSRDEIIRLARETLEGNMRGVLATLTPEQVNEDKMAFAQSLLAEAEHDLSALGLALDTLKIQSVTDDHSYLRSIGRKQSAELLKRARTAEALAKATATVTAAKNHEETVLAQIEARMAIAHAEANRRLVDAKTQRSALIAEEEAEVTSMVARATAELAVQRARIEQIRNQLQAEVVEPAVASRNAMIQHAEGDAAEIIEDGRARAEALGEITDVWLSYGESAKRALLMQKLEPLTELLTSTIDNLEVDNLTFIGSGQNGGGDGDGSAPFSVRALRTMEELKHGAGIDVEAIAKKLAGAQPDPADAPNEERSQARRDRRAARREERAAEIASSSRTNRTAPERAQRRSGRSIRERSAQNRAEASTRSTSPSMTSREGIDLRSGFAAPRAYAPNAATSERRPADVRREAAEATRAASAPSVWFAATPDKRVGPISAADVFRLVERGDLTTEAYVWREGLDNWEPMHESNTLALEAAPYLSR